MEESGRKNKAGGGRARARAAGTGESVSPRGKFLYKKSAFDAGAIWWKAICDSDTELKEHSAAAKKDKVRFYAFRLLEGAAQRDRGFGAG